MCPELSLLSACFDHELCESQQEAIENHLLDCPACRAILELFQFQRDSMKRDFSAIPEKSEHLEEFWEYVGKSRLGRIHGSRMVGVPIPLAIAAILILVISTVLNFLPIGTRMFSDTPMLVESLPPSPTVASFTISMGELDDVIAVLEAIRFSGSDTMMYTLPSELPVVRFGDPLIIRASSVEGAQ